MIDTKDNRGKPTNTKQTRLIHRLAREGWNGNEITKFLPTLFGDHSLHIRAVQNRIKTLRDNQTFWDRLSATGEESAKIMEVLRTVIEDTKGKKRSFTQEEVNWVTWIQGIAPSLPPLYAWRFASNYLADMAEGKKDFKELDTFLASKPWESLSPNLDYDNIQDDDLDRELSELLIEIRNYIAMAEDTQIRAGMDELAQHRLEFDAMRMEISEDSDEHWQEMDWEETNIDDTDIKDLLGEQIALSKEQMSISRAILEELQKLTKNKEDLDEEKWNPYKWPHNDGLP